VVLGFGCIVFPLLIWILKRSDDPFIDHQAKEALNFQITMFIFFSYFSSTMLYYNWRFFAVSFTSN